MNSHLSTRFKDGNTLFVDDLNISSVIKGKAHSRSTYKMPGDKKLFKHRNKKRFRDYERNGILVSSYVDC